MTQALTDLTNLTIVIPAAGMGVRLGRGPKAWLELEGQALVTWVARKALRVADEVIVAAPADALDEMARLCPGCRVVAGGSTRQQTVANLVNAAHTDWVLIHDAARPFASEELMRAVAEAARQTGAAGAFLQPDVPVAHITDGRVTQHFRRDQMGIFQAPQAFSRALLHETHEMAQRAGWEEQSTMQLVLRMGASVSAVPGEKTNIKLTTPEDWPLAQLLKDYLS